MRVLQRLAALAYSVAGLVLSGCDPGYHYMPVDASGRRVERWSRTIEGVRFEMGDYGTLIGSIRTTRPLTVTNSSAKQVEILGAELQSLGRTLKVQVTGKDGREDAEGRSVT